MPAPLSAAGPSRAVVVMGRIPFPGRVKTRLARTLGDELAAELYGAFLLDVFELVEAARRARSFTPVFSVLAQEPQDLSLARALVPSAAWGVSEQRGPTLGDRIEDARRAGAAAHVVVVGSDSPCMPPGRIDAAFAALEEGAYDAVVGPTEDGGYDLIAFAGPAPVLLTDIPWSTSLVLTATRAAARLGGVRLLVLPELGRDIDEPEDLWAWRAVWEGSAPHALAPRTRRVVEVRLGCSQKPSGDPDGPAGSR